jgi:hypothetical protein
LRENYSVALSLSEDAFEHIDELPCTISKFDLPSNDYHGLNFVLLSKDRLYTMADKTLYVFSVSDITSPIATFDFPCNYLPVLIDDDRIFLGIYNS